MTKEELRAQMEELRATMMREAIARVDREIEAKYRAIQQEEKLKENEFLNNNLDEILAKMKEVNVDGLLPTFGYNHLPPFEFSSSEEIDNGTYSFRVKNAYFHGARIYKYATDAQGAEWYRTDGYFMTLDRQ